MPVDWLDAFRVRSTHTFSKKTKLPDSLSVPPNAAVPAVKYIYTFYLVEDVISGYLTPDKNARSI